jgi:tetratricopeptide (TPR) repeat protein
MPLSDHPHILFLVSSPLTADPVAVDRALQELTDALRGIQAPATFVTHVAEADAVASLLARRDRPPFPVLHYLGHGYKPEEVPSGYLIFEGQSGDLRPLRDDQLLSVLNPTGSPEPEFRLAVVTACHSESVAAALHALRIPHIVAVDAEETVTQRAAITFFCRFYQVLLTGGTVAGAFRAGQNAVALDEDLCRLGEKVARAEARKFRLLPEDGDHDRLLWPAPPAGSVQIEPLPALTAPPFHLRPAHFLGRGEHMRDVLARLRERRAVLIQGVSGVGKTELAKEVARWLFARRRVERVAFVDLSPVHDADGARRAIATALGIPPESVPTPGALAATLPSGLLLILDEAENGILRGGKAFRELLEALACAQTCPYILVTSQSDLGSAHFLRYDLRRLTPEAALALFLVEAAVTEGEWQRMEEADLRELLRYTDGLPRAVALTARAWRHSRRPDLKALARDLKEKWDQVMQDPQYPDEVKSVVAGIALAHDRLRERDSGAADFYPYLALFPGGLPEDGLEPIFGPQARRWAAEAENQALLERPWPDLLYLPTPFRLFALRLLGDETAARARHGEAALRFYFDFDDEPHVGWVKWLDKALRESGEAMPAAIARYVQELPSIEAWLDWALEHEPGREGRLRAPSLATLLENIYTVTDRLAREETLARYGRALERARSCGDRLGEANTLKAIGDVLRFRDEYDQALAHYDQALELFRAVGARLGEANTLKAIGDVLRFRDEYDQALAHYDQALELFRAVGARLGEANTLKAIGDVHNFRKEMDQALAHYDQALELFRAVGDRLGEANTLKAIGDVHNFRKEMDQALAHYDQALELFRAVGDRLGEANTLKAIGDVLRFRDEYDQALAHYDQALELFRAVGDRLGEANTLKAIGDVHNFRKEMDQALAHYGQALELFRAVGARLGEANTLKAIGDVHNFRKEMDQALAHYGQALELFRAVGDRLGEANTLKAIGDVHNFRKEMDQALAHYGQALELFRAVGARLGEANTLAGLSRLALREGQEEEARALLQQAVDQHVAIGDRYSVAADLGNFGLALRDMGRQEEARPYLLRAAEIFAQIGLSELAAQMLRAARA